MTSIENSRERKTWWKPKGCGAWVLVIIVLTLIVSALVSNPGNKSNNLDQKTQDKSDLIGDVNFDGSQFHIANKENKDWNTCHFTLNGRYHYPGTSLADKLEVVKANEIISVGSTNFILPDGTRFNPFSIKPTNLSASCESRFGYWTW